METWSLLVTPAFTTPVGNLPTAQTMYSGSNRKRVAETSNPWDVQASSEQFWELYIILSEIGQVDYSTCIRRFME